MSFSIVQLIGKIKSIITDPTNGYQAGVTSSGELKVSSPPPSPPPDTTAVEVTEFGDVSTYSVNYYTITNGDTLYIQRLDAGCDGSTDGSRIELWYDPNGVNTTDGSIPASWENISVLWVNNTNGSRTLDVSYTGDGTKRIVLLRRRIDGGGQEIYGQWQGYTA